MKNILVHFVGDVREPERFSYRFSECPRVSEFISLTDSNDDAWFEVAAVVHVAMSENYDFDETNPNEFVAEIWVREAITANEAIEKFSK